MQLFIEGGALWMSLLTIELIFILFAAWKYPRWMKDLGQLALCTGVLSNLYGFYVAASALSMAPDISASLIYNGVRLALIPIIYAVFIYAISLIIRIIQKPKM